MCAQEQLISITPGSRRITTKSEKMAADYGDVPVEEYVECYAAIRRRIFILDFNLNYFHLTNP